MTLAEKVVASLVPYEGLRETTGNNNRDVPFYPGYLWPDAIFDKEIDPHAFLESYRLLSGLLMEDARERSPRPLILEFGCGPAHMVHYVHSRCDYIGIDGNPDFIRWNGFLDQHKEKFLLLDLAKPIRLENDMGPVKADTICAFEVLEHLYEKDVDTLLESVVHHMKDDARFFCTASNKHRSTKDVHLTVEPREWWLAKFAQHGLNEVDGMADRIMDRHPWNWRHGTTHAFALKRSVG